MYNIRMIFKKYIGNQQEKRNKISHAIKLHM